MSYEQKPCQIHVPPKIECRLGWHEWTKWEPDGEIVRSEIHIPTGTKVPECTFELQKRFCVHCGIKKLRREKR